jgi:molybdopterin-containing oxidoreductase family iron-sulfur binding subunit
MKTIPPPCPYPDTGPKYWRSLEQVADTPEFRQWVEKEFPAGAADLSDPVNRRSFVKLMSASFLLAGFGLTGCRRPVEKIYPFSRMPENYVHGLAIYFATAMPTRGTAIPLVAKSNDGRPTKLEGNSQHPDSNGGTDRYTQASILNLYDPDRATRCMRDGSYAPRDAAIGYLDGLSKEVLANGGEGLHFLAGHSSSPSRARLQRIISEKLPKARWYEHEAVDFDTHRQAATAAFGQPVTPYLRIDQASVIVALDSDFLGGEEELHLNIRRFADGRRMQKAGDPMNRLYAIEGLMTITGANADHRLRLAPSAVPAAAARLLVEVVRLAGLQSQLTGAVDSLAASFKGNDKWITECAADLVANKGRSLVLAGHRQSLAVHLIANALNGVLESFGKTVILQPATDSKAGSISDLAQVLNSSAGDSQTLVILGGNPGYDAPADLNWPATQKKVKTVVRLGYYEDETFPAKGWNLPLAHYLESWGDARTNDGTLVPVQPLIEPLFGGFTEIEVLAHIVGLEKNGSYEIVRDTFREIGGGDDEKWKKFLHDGFLGDSSAKPVAASFNADTVVAALRKEALTPAAAPTRDKLEVIFHRDYKVDDGRFNNNGWMQELPDPITKMTWENVILMSVKTAQDLGVYTVNRENNRIKAPLVTIEVDGRKVVGPVWAQPGQADNTVGLALGYGRAITGRVGKDSGYNAYLIRSSKKLHCAMGAKLTPTGEKHPLSVTQDHGAMEGRPIIREANYEEYSEYKKLHPEGNFALGFNMEKPPLGPAGEHKDPYSLYPNPFYADKIQKSAHHQWGMAIDLTACVGCSSCMVACQSENNIPIVGKNQVANNREMHWIRIDRYFSNPVPKSAEEKARALKELNEDTIQVINQPMLCQHCESAPCENVCPVNATTHDQEGLNVMVYNRCVGTRYCSNNCPYKVRRFNYFDYNRRTLDQLKGPVYSTPLLPSGDQRSALDWWKDPDRGNQPADEWELLKMVKNPDVTVRMRGVMEKCTYCIQRIEGAKIARKVAARDSGDVIVPDGTIKTACQQACPAGAIVFGNIADPESQVSKLKALDRNYSVLDFLNTKPRTTYLARIRNPNPKMPDAYKTPNSTDEFETTNHQNPFESEGGLPHEVEKKGGA